MERMLIVGLIILLIFLIIYKIIIKRRSNLYVKRELNKLPKNYLIISNIIFKKKNKNCHIDFIVVSPYGVFVIETKYYSGEIKGNEYDHNWVINPNKNKKYIYNPIYHNYGNILFLKEKFYLKENELFPIVCITSSNKIDIKSDKIIYVKQLVPLILSYREKIIPNYKILYNDLINEKIYKASKKEKCPKCGGTLIKRTSKYGDFIGCSNYPKCTYIKK